MRSRLPPVNSLTAGLKVSKLNSRRDVRIFIGRYFSATQIAALCREGVGSCFHSVDTDSTFAGAGYPWPCSNSLLRLPPGSEGPSPHLLNRPLSDAAIS
jgi:hypothetical protein